MKFKLLTLSVVLTLLFSNSINSQEVVAEQPVKESADVLLARAYEQAAKENKNVMAIFTASWCRWCNRMVTIMGNENCENLFTKNYVIVKLDVKESKRKKHLETPGARELLEKYEAERQGVPYFMVFNKDGKLLNKSVNDENINIGCPASERDIIVFKKILKETSSMNAKELALIGDEFLLKDEAQTKSN